MLEVAAFMLGFSGVLSVYEVCKGSKHPSTGSKIKSAAEKLGKGKW